MKLSCSFLFIYWGEANEIQQIQKLCKQNIRKNHTKISTTYKIELDVCVTVHHQYNFVNNQQDATTFHLLIFLINPTYFRRQIRPSSGALFLTVYTAFGTMHRQCCRPVPRLRWNEVPSQPTYDLHCTTYDLYCTIITVKYCLEEN